MLLYFCCTLRQVLRFCIAGCGLFLLLLFSGCKSDTEFENNKENPIAVTECVTKAPSLLKLFMCLKDATPSLLIPKTANLQWLDSLTTDGDGVALSVDLGKGMFCADAANRRGKLLFFTKSPQNFNNTDSIFCNADANDSFAIYGKQGWYYFSGNIVLSAQSLTRFKIDVNSDYENNKVKNAHLKASYEFVKENLTFNQPYLSDNYLLVTAKGTMKLNESFWGFDGGGHFMGASCLYGFQNGSLNLTGPAYKARIDFDAFSNSTCDELAKITIGSRETLFSFW